MPHCVYIVECTDAAGSLYTGYTTDVTRRISQHNSGNGAKYTRGRTPVTVRYVEYHPSRSAAQTREYEIKSLSRATKQDLIDSPDQQVPISIRLDGT